MRCRGYPLTGVQEQSIVLTRGSRRTMSRSLGAYAAQKTADRKHGPYFLFNSFFSLGNKLSWCMQEGGS